MTHLMPNLCSACANLMRETPADEDLKRCRAFPEGIPPDIWDGVTSHWDPFEDGSDSDISFEPSEECEDALLTFITFHYEFEGDEVHDTPFIEPDEPRPVGGRSDEPPVVG